MYTATENWVIARVTAVNTIINSSTLELKAIETTFEITGNASSESDKHYQIKIKGWEYEEKEGYDTLIVDVVTEFVFDISNNRANYGTMIQNYLQRFMRELVRAGTANTTSGSYTCYGTINAPRIENVDEFQGDYVYPKVLFKVKVYDATT